MKLSCNVTRDLLPLYHDGVCSEESGALVEEHIAECEDCRAILNELRGEIEIPREEPDDLAPLEKIEQNVKKGKKRAWMKGIAAALAVVLVIFAGANIWWYADTYSYYQQFAEGHTPSFAGVNNIYVWSEGGYDFYVTVPRYPSDSNQLYVCETMRPDPRNIVPGQEVYTWLNIGREEFTYQVGLKITTRTQISGQPHLKTKEEMVYLELDEDLNLLFPDYLGEWDIAHQKQIMEELYLPISRIIQAAQSQWPFLAE